MPQPLHALTAILPCNDLDASEASLITGFRLRQSYRHFRAIGRMTRNLVSDSAA
jgi:hypothetical protein